MPNNKLKNIETIEVPLKLTVANWQKLAEAGRLRIEVPKMLMGIGCWDSTSVSGDNIIALAADSLGKLHVTLGTSTVTIAGAVTVSSLPAVSTEFAESSLFLHVANAAGNATHTCGSADQIWHVHSAIYEEKGAATPAITIFQSNSRFSATVTVTASVSTNLLLGASSFVVDGATALSCSNGAAGDVWTITAQRQTY